MSGLIVYGPPPYKPSTRGIRKVTEPNETVSHIRERIAEIKGDLAMVPAWELELKALEAALAGYASVKKPTQARIRTRKKRD
jgi:hypothetical protein